MQNASPATAACLLFLFLLLLPAASPQCRAATDAECRKSDSFIPGHGLASRGFDITTLKFSISPVFNLNEWQNPGGTCTLCENPLLQGKPRQRLPLGITNWTAAIACQQEVQHTPSCISLADAVSRLFVRSDWKKDLDVEPDPSTYTQYALMGTDSEAVSFCKEKTQEDKYIFLLHHASCSYYKFSIPDNRLLSTTFNNTINALPEKYDSTSKWDYYTIIQRYGTHFVKEVDVGALIWYLTGIQGCRVPLESFTLSEISRCLEIEVGVLIGLEEMMKDPDFQKCKQKITEETYQFLVSNYMKHIEGGLTFYLDFSNRAYNFPESFKSWRESAKSLPALLSFSIEPLHTLVDAANPRRESLRQAVSEYVRRVTLLRTCALPCPPGVQLSAWDPCSCECPNNNLTNSMCCSQQRGLAKLTVTIHRAEGLWGDFFTPSDGYVSVSFQSKTMCTPTVWNNNNPRWNVSLDMGIVKLTEDFTKVKIEVWDEDYGWDDDRLGTCTLTLKTWDPETEHDCKLRHGHIYYKGYLVCGYHLGGPSCRDYLPR
ncbi:hypothetical protein lerEdw1_013172 [Lerista edwardsae]|nr:hypothetical protein lerEdw1_013172 [Lerista edwardsae]